MQYGGGPILVHGGRCDLPEYVVLATYYSETWDCEPQRGTMVGTPAILAARFGKGRVLLFSPHPEASEGLLPLVHRALLATAQMPSGKHAP
jgi:glutamine amidotransferase-like uncharacterized protein